VGSISSWDTPGTDLSQESGESEWGHIHDFPRSFKSIAVVEPRIKL
jgi:hypothetical protein